MVRRLPPQPSERVTRVVARPHGWMFLIPLRDWISCGYVFNPLLSSDEEVAADHTAFLHEQGVATWEQRVAPSFPNFIRRRMFDGRVFFVGNAALFIEPLEATTIGHAIGQVRWATRWIAEEGRGRCADPAESEAYNRIMLSVGCRDSLFVAWHYACGSRWERRSGTTPAAASRAPASIPRRRRTSPTCRSTSRPADYCPARNSPTWRTRSNGNAKFPVAED